MKKTFFALTAVLCGIVTSYGNNLAGDSTSFDINHGPYLLGRTTDGITAAFEMNRKSLSWVEVMEDGGNDTRRVYDSRHGLRQANNTRNGIRIGGLQSGKNYKYRVCSKEITLFNPYDVRFGDSVASPWYGFSMPTPDKSEGSYLFISDMHSLPMKFDTLLRLGGLDVNSVFMGGDMVNDAMGPEDPYIILDKATELFAKHIPMSFVRGNHETRGVYSRFVADFFPTPSGKFYTTFSDGQILFIMLDCGEDKADDTPVYAGCADFDAYRSEQAQWLKQLVETPEFKNAKYRIVATHIPPSPDGWHGNKDAYNKWMPILNKAGIDLMLCGHTHRFGLIERQEGKYEFPVVIGSNNSVTRIDVKGNNIVINVIQKDGAKLIDNMVIKK